MEQYSGPLPKAEDLAKYEALLPGAADRIFVMAEKQLSHRHDLERTVVHGNVAAQKLGQVFGLVVALFALGASAYLGVHGKEAAAAVIGGSTVLGLVSLFVTGRNRQQREREQNV